MPPPTGQTTYRHAVVPAPRVRAAGAASIVVASPAGVQAVALRAGESLVVGRAAPAQVVVEDKSLSRSHARFELHDGHVRVEDLGSTNGTWLGEERIEEGWLDDGERVRLGEVEVYVSAASLQRDDAAQDLESWSARLAEELERARTFGRPVSVLAVRDAQGPDAAVWQGLEERLRPVDRLCLYAPRIALVLLSEMPGAAAESWLRAASGSANEGRFASAVASYPGAASNPDALLERVIDALRGVRPGQVVHAASEPTTRARPPGGQGDPVVKAECMKRLYALVQRVARTTMPVLVLGETGSGKEHVARAVHESSPRSAGPFVAFNCAVLPNNLVESVLFGHEKGAFTGADKRQAGAFEQAHGGTLFLDEVGELSPEAQAALLRVLETKRIRRVGSTEEVEVDVRVVAATHRDLGQMVKRGEFREDLMYRLDALSLSVPPLRERRVEIAPLAQTFLKAAAEAWEVSAEGFAPEALARMESYPWPGNVRQLKNAVERAAAVCEDGVIGLDDLPEGVAVGELVAVSGQEVAEGGRGVADGRGGGELAVEPGGGDDAPGFNERVRAYEVELIRAALEKTGGNQSKAAVLLGIPRRTLANKVHGYGLVG